MPDHHSDIAVNWQHGRDCEQVCQPPRSGTGGTGRQNWHLRRILV